MVKPTVSRETLSARTTCICGAYPLYRGIHCFNCHQLYRCGRMKIGASWYRVHTTGSMDAFALPALGWQVGSEVSAPFAVAELERTN